MEPKTIKYLTTEQINSIKKKSSLEANTHYSSFMLVMESEGLLLCSQQPAALPHPKQHDPSPRLTVRRFKWSVTFSGPH
jgi:hypothetical protein